MTQSNITSEYNLAAARGTSPLGLIVALYDTLLRDIQRAQNALESGDVERRIFEVHHALMVLATLQNLLNFERGGEPARRLNNLYLILRGEIVQANMSSSREGYVRLRELILPVRNAWEEVSHTVSASISEAPDSSAADRQERAANSIPAVTSTVSVPAPSHEIGKLDVEHAGTGWSA